MATRRKKNRKKSSAPKKHPRRARKARKAAAVTTRKRRKRVRAEAKTSRRRKRRATVMQANVVQTSRRKRKKRRTRRVKAWRGNPAGHAKAARKGWKKKRAKAARKGWKKKRAAALAPRRRKRRKSRTREVTAVAAPRRRRRRVRASVVQAPRRRRRSRGMFEPRGGQMGAGEFAVVFSTAGLGFVLADGLDRLLATYNPAGTEPPKDKFTSSGPGTLANVLNIGSMPSWTRYAAAGGSVVVAPAVIAALNVKNKHARMAAAGFTLGAGISAFRLLWNNVFMPMLVGKDTSGPALQKSVFARLYPAEVAARINRQAAGGATAVSSSGSGALADGPQAGIGAPAGDVGPFALAAESPYPDTAQALRREAGMGGDSPYPSTSQALRREAGMGGDSPYPSTSQALHHEAGMGAAWQPGPPSDIGPGPQGSGADSSCGCVGDPPLSGLLGDPPPESEQPLFTVTR